MIFRDRTDAARQLAEKLKKYQRTTAVILAVPRGGVHIGHVLAQHLRLPLEIVLTKKIGHPENPEFAIGAVSLTGVFLGNAAKTVPTSFMSAEVDRLRSRLRQQAIKYRGKREAVSLQNKTAILVDDGIATGQTMQAAIQLIRQEQPSKIVVAVPIAPPDTVGLLSKDVDELICLHTPEVFFAIGQFYQHFEQVSDEEVKHFLNAANV